MLGVGFELTTAVVERAKTFHAFDHAATEFQILRSLVHIFAVFIYCNLQLDMTKLNWFLSAFSSVRLLKI
jgi:hypothetical protein